MSNNNGSGELERKKRRLKATFDDARWAFSESILLSKYIFRLVEQDIKDRCPDTFEKIMQLMDVHERLGEQLLDSLDEAVKFRRENDLDVSRLYGLGYENEDTRTAMRNLRLDLINWVKWFEVKRPMPTPEEEAAAKIEEAEACRTGGASLLREAAS